MDCDTHFDLALQAMVKEEVMEEEVQNQTEIKQKNVSDTTRNNNSELGLKKVKTEEEDVELEAQHCTLSAVKLEPDFLLTTPDCVLDDSWDFKPNIPTPEQLTEMMQQVLPIRNNCEELDAPRKTSKRKFTAPSLIVQPRNGKIPYQNFDYLVEQNHIEFEITHKEAIEKEKLQRKRQLVAINSTGSKKSTYKSQVAPYKTPKNYKRRENPNKKRIAKNAQKKREAVETQKCDQKQECVSVNTQAILQNAQLEAPPPPNSNLFASLFNTLVAQRLVPQHPIYAPTPIYPPGLEQILRSLQTTQTIFGQNVQPLTGSLGAVNNNGPVIPNINLNLLN